MISDSSDLPVSASARLLFDAVGTLIYAEPGPAAVYEAVGRRFGSTLTLGEIERRFRKAFAAEEASDRGDSEGRTSEERERRRWRTIVATVLNDVSDGEAVFAELWNHFARPDAWRPFDDAIEVVPRLVERGAAVGVASNFDARLHAIIAAHFQAIRPEHVFTSSELGHRKPSRGFFAECERQLGATAASCVLVGDDPENDILGAQAAGWFAILLDRRASDADDAPRIGDLFALVR